MKEEINFENLKVGDKLYRCVPFVRWGAVILDYCELSVIKKFTESVRVVDVDRLTNDSSVHAYNVEKRITGYFFRDEKVAIKWAFDRVKGLIKAYTKELTTITKKHRKYNKYQYILRKFKEYSSCIHKDFIDIDGINRIDKKYGKEDAKRVEEHLSC